jgi:hypothetical protein
MIFYDPFHALSVTVLDENAAAMKKPAKIAITLLPPEYQAGACVHKKETVCTASYGRIPLFCSFNFCYNGKKYYS